MNTVEYKMSKILASEILKKHKNVRGNSQDILVNYVNTQCGLLRHCVRVIVG